MQYAYTPVYEGYLKSNLRLTGKEIRKKKNILLHTKVLLTLLVRVTFSPAFTIPHRQTLPLWYSAKS